MSKKPKKKWTLPKFFERWYVDAVTQTKTRKAAGPATVRSRRNGIRRWVQVMATSKRPQGPQLGEIKTEHLETFWHGLQSATYNRGGGDRLLSPVTRYNRFQDIVIVLAAAGPINGNRPRAGVLKSVPSLYLEPVNHFPKETWTLDEVRTFVAAIDRFKPPVADLKSYRLNLKAWIALCYYTGHRASTYKAISRNDLREIRPGSWVLDIVKSVKTGKPARVPVHVQLLKLLNDLPNDSISFPVLDRTMFNHFKALQRFAGLSESRVFGPQAFRRLHCQSLIELGIDQAQKIGSGSLGHSSSAVTKAHYGDAESMMVPMLPSIFKFKTELLPC